jgi:hypothetical protein
LILFDSNFDIKKIWEKIVFESSVLTWIRIEQKCWIRIHIKWIRIHNPDMNFRYKMYKNITSQKSLSWAFDNNFQQYIMASH